MVIPLSCVSDFLVDISHFFPFVASSIGRGPHPFLNHLWATSGCAISTGVYMKAGIAPQASKDYLRVFSSLLHYNRLARRPFASWSLRELGKWFTLKNYTISSLLSLLKRERNTSEWNEMSRPRNRTNWSHTFLKFYKRRFCYNNIKRHLIR